MKLQLTLSCLSLFAVAASAQVNDVPPPRRERVPTGDVPVVEPFVPDGAGVFAEPASPGVVTRRKLEEEDGLAFGEVPGGIVFGVSARSLDAAFSAREIVVPDGGRLELALADGRRLALPAADPGLLLPCLRFVTEGAGHWLVDVDVAGNVLLAREWVDTAAGLAAVRADLAPLFFMPTDVGVKSTLVDRDVRMIAGEAGLRFEVDLELRFYRPSRREGETSAGRSGDAERVLTAPLLHVDGSQGQRLVAPEELERPGALLAAHLGDLADLAGWIAFFRYAAANEVAGLSELRAHLDALAVDPVSTPRRIHERDRAAWVRGAGVAPSSEIPEWMREHARRHAGAPSRDPR